MTEGSRILGPSRTVSSPDFQWIFSHDLKFFHQKTDIDAYVEHESIRPALLAMDRFLLFNRVLSCQNKEWSSADDAFHQQ